MPYLIAYDIEHNPTRDRVAKRLLELGLYRLQKSVFAGEVSQRRLQNFVAKTVPLLEPPPQGNDRLMVLRLGYEQSQQIQFYGEPPPDLELMFGNPSTLIF